MTSDFSSRAHNWTRRRQMRSLATFQPMIETENIARASARTMPPRESERHREVSISREARVCVLACRPDIGSVARAHRPRANPSRSRLPSTCCRTRRSACDTSRPSHLDCDARVSRCGEYERIPSARSVTGSAAETAPESFAWSHTRRSPSRRRSRSTQRVPAIGDSKWRLDACGKRDT